MRITSRQRLTKFGRYTILQYTTVTIVHFVVTFQYMYDYIHRCWLLLNLTNSFMRDS